MGISLKVIKKDHFVVYMTEPGRIEVSVETLGSDGAKLLQAMVYQGAVTDPDQEPVGAYDGSLSPEEQTNWSVGSDTFRHVCLQHDQTGPASSLTCWAEPGMDDVVRDMEQVYVELLSLRSFGGISPLLQSSLCRLRDAIATHCTGRYGDPREVQHFFEYIVAAGKNPANAVNKEQA